MQSHQDRSDYPTVDDSSFPSTAQSDNSAGTAVSALEPYTPPNVPHGLPHVVRYAALSRIDLPLEVRFMIIMIAQFADVHGVASVAISTPCDICRVGSHHTESPETLARDTYFTPVPGTCTHLGRHLSQAPMPCRKGPVKVFGTARFIFNATPLVPA